MKSYLILGLGLFGKSMARTLCEMGHEVLAADDDLEIVNSFSRFVTHTVQANVTDDEFLESLDVRKFDAAVVAVGSKIQVSIMATVLLKELGARYVLVKAQDEFEAKILRKVGADMVVLPENDMGVKAAHSLVSNNVFDAIELSNDYSIVSLAVPESWCGKSIGKLMVRSRFGVNIVAIKFEDDRVIVPGVEQTLQRGMVLTLMGANESLARINHIK